MSNNADKFLKEMGCEQQNNKEAVVEFEEVEKKEQLRKDKIKSRTIAGRW